MSAMLRLASRKDAPQIADLYRPFVIGTPISFEATAPDNEEMASRIVTVTARYPWLVCEVDGQIAGYAYASQHRVRFHYQWSIDCSVYVDEGFRKMGIATALYTSLLTIVQAQGYVCAFAGITLPNEASVGFHESVGFEKLGVYNNVGFKLDRWHSVGWWQMELQLPKTPPPQILAIPDLLDTSDWNQAIELGQQKLRL
jgi:phosphinothricin acetyltransferase